ncbi:MAG: site-specific integrase [Pseudonocardiaceae bacterium]
MATVLDSSAREPAPTFGHVCEAFLAAHSRAGAWSPGTVVKYRQTLTGLVAGLADEPVEQSVAALDTATGAASLETAFTAAYGALAPATRARHLAALRSALDWWRTVAWLVGDPTRGWARPKISRDDSRALTPDQVAALWRLDVTVREKTLWRLLYETAARATEILTLDVADLDPVNKRARVVSKGGDTEWVYYQTGAALLLPRLLAGRSRGPVFLADRTPTRAVPGLDLCPITGRARLSYRRAAELFEHVT